jgi:polyphenol oxidase
MKEPFILQNDIFHLHEWEKDSPELTVAFSSRNGGISSPPYDTNNLGLHVNDNKNSVINNRQLTADKLNWELSSWTAADQIHEDQIVKVTSPLSGSGARSYEDTIKRTDALYTAETNILLTLGYADCVPVYFFSREKGLVGIAHAGWKGTVKNIAGKMVRLWQEMENIHPGSIHAAIGPSISHCCYEVDDRVINSLEETLPDWKPYEKIEEGRYRLQLKEANYRLLIQEGVPPEHIYVSSYCTSCSEDLFFSHRRDRGKTGRMMAFIGRNK